MRDNRNEYDFMKDLITKMKSTKLVTEQDKVTVRTLNEVELQDEQKKFTEAVGGPVDFGAFNIYSDNIEWNGTFTSERITWSYSLDASVGCYITCNSTQLSDETVQKLQKLKGYYDVWAVYWANELSVQ